MNSPNLETVLRAYFARDPGYGVGITRKSADQSEIDIRVTFLADRSYCCAEPGCHFSLEGFRKVAVENGLILPDQLRVWFHGIVEDGAILQCHAQFGQPLRCKAYEFDAVFPQEG